MTASRESGPGVYEKLGIRPVINAQGGVTDLGGSILIPSVRRAMDETSDSFVSMGELLEKSGEYIASILGVEAAFVASGAAAALTLSAAACIAGADKDRIGRLPDTTGMKDEIIIQKNQRYGFERCFAYPGGKLVNVGDESGCTADQLEDAIGPKTAAVAYPVMVTWPGEGQTPEEPGWSNAKVSSVGTSTGWGGPVLPIEDTMEVARRHDVPVVADAAWQIWPLDDCRKTAQSADLVCFGAKYMGAPHSTGIVCGRKDLVDAVTANGFIASVAGIGRPMKVDRQEIVGAALAVENWFSMDHEQRLRSWIEKLTTIESGLEGMAGVRTERIQFINYVRIALLVVVDAETVGKDAQRVADELMDGSPRVAVLVPDNNTIEVRAYNLYDGEEHAITERLRSVLAT